MSVSAPDPTLDFAGLFATEDEDAIWGRAADWANEGLDPVADADAWVDTREGGHWRTVLTPLVREVARLYDVAGTEVPMSAMVLWAWGTYLDDLAAVWDITRLPATYSRGIVSFTGTPGDDISFGTTVSADPDTPDDPAPAFVVQVEGTIPGGGEIDLPIQAQDAGRAGDVAANAITVQSTPLPGVTFTNLAPTLGGTDPETDDALRARVLAALVGKGPGTRADYLQWAGAYPSVGHVKVVPLWRGPGTVLVMATDPNDQPLPSGSVDGLQAELDPTPGLGDGIAPIGAAVTVETSALLAVDVATAGITYEDGYSADGAGGTIAVQDDLQDQIAAYFLGVQPGDDVILARVSGIIATWPGVHDFTGVTLNGVAANLAVGLDPPEAPVLNSLTLG